MSASIEALTKRLIANRPGGVPGRDPRPVPSPIRPIVVARRSGRIGDDETFPVGHDALGKVSALTISSELMISLICSR